MGRRRIRSGLVAVRRAAGYTQESLADALQVDRSTVVRWESGERMPTPHVLPKLSRLLDRSPAAIYELLGDAGTEAKVPASVPWLGARAGWSPGDAHRRYRALNSHDAGGSRGREADRRSAVPRSAVAGRLVDFYGTSSSDSPGVYAASCEGQELTTSVVTRGDWIDRRSTLRDVCAVVTHLGDATPLPPLDEMTASAALARLADAEMLGGRMFNAPIYNLDTLDTVDGTLSARFRVSSFLDYACSSDLLEAELSTATERGDGCLPLRARLLPDLAAVLDPATRMCAGGVLGVVRRGTSSGEARGRP